MKNSNKLTMSLLFKFGQKSHMEELLKEGKIFFNTIKFFQDCSNNLERGDKNEGLLTQIFNADVYDENEKLIASNADAKLFSYLPMPFFLQITHIYCMTGIFIPFNAHSEDTFFDKRIFRFGDSFVIINYIQEFFDRITAKLQRDYEMKKITYFSRGKVEYKHLPQDKTISMVENNLFSKDLKYEYQNELRIILGATDPTKPYEVKLGSIEDIAIIMDVGEFQNKYKRSNKGIHLY